MFFRHQPAVAVWFVTGLTGGKLAPVPPRSSTASRTADSKSLFWAEWCFHGEIMLQTPGNEWSIQNSSASPHRSQDQVREAKRRALEGNQAALRFILAEHVFADRDSLKSSHLSLRQ